MSDETPETYQIYVSDSGVPYIDGQEFFGSKAGQRLVSRAAEFGRKHVNKEKPTPTMDELLARAANMLSRQHHERLSLRDEFCKALRPFAKARLKATKPFKHQMNQHWITGILLQAGHVLVDLEDPADGREWSKFAKDMNLRELVQVAEAAEGIVQQTQLSDL